MDHLVKGYYHCDNCDSIFESSSSAVSQLSCPYCGHIIAGSYTAPPETDFEADSALSDIDDGGVSNDIAHDQNHDFNRSSGAEQVVREDPAVAQKKREAHHMKLISISWIVFVVLVVTVVIYFNSSSDRFTGNTTSSQLDSGKQIDAERQELKLSLPKCMTVVKRFLNAETASAKAQFVYDGVRLSREMEDYYSGQADLRPSLLQVRPIVYHALHIAGSQAIGTVCQTDTGERFEAIFILDDGEWKIEWKSFVRYSERDWALFKTGADGDEADFRLYMRVMDVREDLAAGDVLVQFYKPDIFRGHMFDGYASDVIRVPAYSGQGKLLRGLIERSAAAEDEDLVGMQISEFDPKQLYRVRVRMKLGLNAKQQPEVNLVRLIANHWYDPAIVKKNSLAEELK